MYLTFTFLTCSFSFDVFFQFPRGALRIQGGRMPPPIPPPSQMKPCRTLSVFASCSPNALSHVLLISSRSCLLCFFSNPFNSQYFIHLSLLFFTCLAVHYKITCYVKWRFAPPKFTCLGLSHVHPTFAWTFNTTPSVQMRKRTTAVLSWLLRSKGTASRPNPSLEG